MRQDDVSATGLISAPLPFPALILFENRIRIQWLSRVRLVGSRCAISLETPDRRLFRSQRDTEAMNLTSASSPKVSKNKKAQNPLLSCFFNEIDKMLPSATRAFAPPPMPPRYVVRFKVCVSRFEASLPTKRLHPPALSGLSKSSRYEHPISRNAVR